MLGEHRYAAEQQNQQVQLHNHIFQNQISLTDPTIIVQCQRKDIGTRHAQIGVHKHGVSIWYGNLIRENNRAVFHVAFDHTEFISYSLYPEARYLHDGNAWDVDELYAWMTGHFVDESDEGDA